MVWDHEVGGSNPLTPIFAWQERFLLLRYAFYLCRSSKLTAAIVIVKLEANAGVTQW